MSGTKQRLQKSRTGMGTIPSSASEDPAQSVKQQKHHKSVYTWSIYNLSPSSLNPSSHVSADHFFPHLVWLEVGYPREVAQPPAANQCHPKHPDAASADENPAPQLRKSHPSMFSTLCGSFKVFFAGIVNWKLLISSHRMEFWWGLSRARPFLPWEGTESQSMSPVGRACRGYCHPGKQDEVAALARSSHPSSPSLHWHKQSNSDSLTANPTCSRSLKAESMLQFYKTLHT